MRQVVEVVTETGSLYQIDAASNEIRRVWGQGRPTVRVGQDGVWREYVEVVGMSVGACLGIIWSDMDAEGVLRTTLTSKVVCVGVGEV